MQYLLITPIETFLTITLELYHRFGRYDLDRFFVPADRSPKIHTVQNETLLTFSSHNRLLVRAFD